MQSFTAFFFWPHLHIFARLTPLPKTSSHSVLPSPRAEVAYARVAFNSYPSGLGEITGSLSPFPQISTNLQLTQTSTGRETRTTGPSSVTSFPRPFRRAPPSFRVAFATPKLGETPGTPSPPDRESAATSTQAS